MMKSTRLSSGNISDFKPIGQDGNPVYLNADAFRSALSINPSVGEERVQHLAVSKISADGKSIEWYAPFSPRNADGQYRIVHWASASPEERVAAMSQLRDLEQRLQKLGRDLARRGGEGQSMLFAHYLTGQSSISKLPAIHFPGPEYVYIVDGTPVITFWGFTNKDADLNTSPLSQLNTSGVELAASSADELLEDPPGRPSRPIDLTSEPVPPVDDRRHKCDMLFGLTHSCKGWPKILLGILLGLLLLALLFWLLCKFFNICLFGGFGGGNAGDGINQQEPAIEQPLDNQNTGDQAPPAEVPPADNAAQDGAPQDTAAGPQEPQANATQGGAQPGATGTSNVVLMDQTGAGAGSEPPLPETAGEMPADGTVLAQDQGAAIPVDENAVGVVEEPNSTTIANEDPVVVDEAAEQIVAGDKDVVVDPAADQIIPGEDNVTVDQQLNQLTPEQRAAIEEARKAEAEVMQQNGVEPIPPVDVQMPPEEFAKLPVEQQEAIKAAQQAEAATVNDKQAKTTRPTVVPPDLSFTSNDVAAKGVSAINGNWKTRSPLMDESNGKPLQMQYNIKDGKGQITVTRPDGVKCVTDISSGVNGGSINIGAGGRATCPDNKSYRVPNIKCSPSSDGKVNCTGTIGNQKFPIQLYGSQG